MPGLISFYLQVSKYYRLPTNKPKPNTRFLRNIIKDTDSHNAALLSKEAAESRVRLESLSRNGHREERVSRLGGGDIRRRQLGDIAAILGGRPSKRRTELPKENDYGPRRANTSSEDEEPYKKTEGNRSSHRHRRDRHRQEESRIRRHESKDDKDNGRKDSSAHRSGHKRKRSSSEDQGLDARGRRQQDGSIGRSKSGERRRRESRSRSPQHRSKDERLHRRSSKSTPSMSAELQKDKPHRDHRRRRSPSSQRRDSREDKKAVTIEENKIDSDSDPLDEIIGPRPAPTPVVKTRGRGTVSFTSGIDSRFSASYDPTVDVQLDLDEENDWDQALEALRDRQKWKQQGADRLRAAGFTENEVAKWEKGGEKREEDVKWAKHGEGREWDRGKVMDDDGVITTASSWGRLKDN